MRAGPTSGSLFTSKRERRLWFWTLAVVAAIYSTLGLARTLAGLLGEGDALFFFLMFLVVATIATQALKVRPGGAEIAVALGVVVYLFAFSRMASRMGTSRDLSIG